MIEAVRSQDSLARGSAPVSPSGYRAEIDSLRALAVVAVILNHIDERLLPSGYLGVDVFFVISGFVITASLTRHPAHSLGDLLLDFYSRRLKRLVPALLLFVVVVGVLACLVIPRPHAALCARGSAPCSGSPTSTSMGRPPMTSAPPPSSTPFPTPGRWGWRSRITSCSHWWPG